MGSGPCRSLHGRLLSSADRGCRLRAPGSARARTDVRAERRPGLPNHGLPRALPEGAPRRRHLSRPERGARRRGHGARPRPQALRLRLRRPLHDSRAARRPRRFDGGRDDPPRGRLATRGRGAPGRLAGAAARAPAAAAGRRGLHRRVPRYRKAVGDGPPRPKRAPALHPPLLGLGRPPHGGLRHDPSLHARRAARALHVRVPACHLRAAPIRRHRARAECARAHRQLLAQALPPDDERPNG